MLFSFLLSFSLSDYHPGFFIRQTIFSKEYENISPVFHRRRHFSRKKAGIMQKFFKLFSAVRVTNAFAAKPADRQEPQQTGFGRSGGIKKPPAVLHRAATSLVPLKYPDCSLFTTFVIIARFQPVCKIFFHFFSPFRQIFPHIMLS